MNTEKINAFCPLIKGTCKNDQCYFCLLSSDGNKNICLMRGALRYLFEKEKGLGVV